MKIESHVLKLMEVEMISWAIYMIMDYQFFVTNYLLNISFKSIFNILIFWPWINWSSLVLWNTAKPQVICKNVENFKKKKFQKAKICEGKYNIYKNIQQFYLSTCNFQIKLIIGQTYVEPALVPWYCKMTLWTLSLKGCNQS